MSCYSQVMHVMSTLLKFPSQPESSLITIIFQERTVKLQGCNPLCSLLPSAVVVLDEGANGCWKNTEQNTEGMTAALEGGTKHRL